MKLLITFLVLILVTLSFSQDSLYTGVWTAEKQYIADDGVAHYHRVVATINEDSTFVIKSAHKAFAIIWNIDTTTYLVSEGTWMMGDSILQLQVNHRFSDEYDTKYFKNFPKMAMAFSPTGDLFLVEPVYNYRITTQSIPMNRPKQDEDIKNIIPNDDEGIKL